MPTNDRTPSDQSTSPEPKLAIEDLSQVVEVPSAEKVKGGAIKAPPDTANSLGSNLKAH